MIFAPQPENDFRLFYRTYFERCRARCPKLRVVAAKWTFEDLIPGLSDYDTRFIADDGVTLAEWHAYSVAVGQVHTEMALEFPRWARNLEHLPGLNLTISEITNPLFYYPEFKQWTYYEGDPRKLEEIDRYLRGVAWSMRDEIFHLKKIAIYFGAYARGIDPPINIGPWESKYPLHSRYMHYFTPAVQAMVSLKLGRTVHGKMEALRLAREAFANPGTIDRVFDAVSRHYEIAEDYVEPRLTMIERELEKYLADTWVALADRVTLIAVSPADTREDIRKKVAAIPVDPTEAFYEGVKFSRFMKGRLLFYASDIAWFDSIWLIQNELGRIVANFHDKPLKTYAKVRWGEMLSPQEVLERLRGEVLTAEECAGMAAFAKVAGSPLIPGREKEQARAAAEVYEPALAVLEKLSADMLQRVPAGRGGQA